MQKCPTFMGNVRQLKILNAHVSHKEAYRPKSVRSSQLYPKSPFVPKTLHRWLKDHQRLMETFTRLAKLPSVQHGWGAQQLNRDFTRSNNNSYDVVLHLPSPTKQSGILVQQMKHYLSYTSNWMHWTEGERSATIVNCRDLLSAAEEFSEWVTEIISDVTNVRYIIDYEERAGTPTGQTPIRLYTRISRELLNANFKIPKPPGQVRVDGNRRGVITLSFEAEETGNSLCYLVQYRNVSRSEESWNSIQHYSKCITIDYLHSNESYIFRVAIVTLGGRSPFGSVSNQITVDSICPSPSQLQCLSVTDTSAFISWDHHMQDEGNSFQKKVKQISYYSIECWADGNRQNSNLIQRSTKEKTFTLEPLVGDATYCVQIRAAYVDNTGSTFYSPASPILKVRTMKRPERAAHTVKRVSQKCSIEPGIDGYKIPLKKEHRENQTPGVGHYVFGQRSYSALVGKRRQRTILMLGATGSGKSTLINAMINYILDVKWDDDFRFKLIDEPADKSQAHSQTELMTTYELYETKGSRLDYSLTVVDTPGFGDTLGVEKDRKIMEQIQDYFHSRHGIQQLEAVCLVVQSSLPRLTATQRYIFDSILSIFGKDIKDNIRLMVTFADNAEPPALAAVTEAGIPSPVDPKTGLPVHHKFNNSIFFTSKKADRMTNEFNRTGFNMAVQGFDRFFEDLRQMEAKSMTLTRQVLDERKKLEALLEGLQTMTQMKLYHVEQFEQTQKRLTESRHQMEANKNFVFSVEYPTLKSIDISGTGQFTTNCENCQKTCHFPCRQASDENKDKCSVMDQRGRCRICRCSWSHHFNQKYRYEMVVEKVMRSSDTIQREYQTANDEMLTNAQLLDRIQMKINEQGDHIGYLMQATYPHIGKLNEIALRPHPMSSPAYIDLMIEAEKMENQKGFQERIVALQKLRQMAVIMTEAIENQKNGVTWRPTVRPPRQVHSVPRGNLTNYSVPVTNTNFSDSRLSNISNFSNPVPTYSVPTAFTNHNRLIHRPATSSYSDPWSNVPGSTIASPKPNAASLSNPFPNFSVPNISNFVSNWDYQRNMSSFVNSNKDNLNGLDTFLNLFA